MDSELQKVFNLVIEGLGGSIADNVGRSVNANITIMMGLLRLLMHKGLLDRGDIMALCDMLERTANPAEGEKPASADLVMAFVEIAREELANGHDGGET